MAKYRITLAVVLLSMMWFAPKVSAQGAMGGSGQGDMGQPAAKLEKMSAALQLTPAQKKQVRPILMQEAPKIEALKSDTSMRPTPLGTSIR